MILNKLAAGVTAFAIATTAISVPAKADNKDITTLLAILAGGLVIHEIIDNKKDRKREDVTVTRDKHKKRRDKRIKHKHRDGEWYTHRNLAELQYYHSKAGRDDRRRDRHGRVIDAPIQDTHFELPLPNKCRRTLTGRFGSSKDGMSGKCLRNKGYKVSKSGRVTHPDYRKRSAYPRLF